MLPSYRYTGFAHTCDNNIVHKARKWWYAADEESSDSTPVGCDFGLVSIYNMEIVHIWDGYSSTPNDIVTAICESFAPKTITEQ